MAKRSAGILMYRGSSHALELLLVHPGGPFWASKDQGAWSIPEGRIRRRRRPAGRRQARVHRGARARVRSGPTKFLDLGEIVQPSRQVVTAFAVEGDFDPATLTSNCFELEWPPKSGQKQSFPEVDRAQWFALDEARKKILPGQAPFIDRLLEYLGR